MSYFRKFPKIDYQINKNGTAGYETVTNIFFRVKILEEIKNNSFAYFYYLAKDGDRLDIIAKNLYDNPDYHWIIAMTNDMTDPLHDMPKDYNSFNKYIKSKYGSLATAKTTIHHYEKRITRTNNKALAENVVTIEVDEDTYNDLAESSYEAFNFGDGTTIEVVITRHAITNYEYEVIENDKKRNLKIIQPMYLPQILKEFNDISKASKGLPVGYRSYS